MTLALVLRVIHIVLGVFWAGAVFFLVLFLAPAVGRVGPDGGKVMAEIDRARFLEVMPILALVTILSGVWLMWIVSGGFAGAFFSSGWGQSLTVGGAAALVAFLIGTLRMRPATKRVLGLGPQMAAATSDEERARLGAEMQALRKRARKASVWVAWLLLVAVAGMAAARYV
ncbi:MAG: hypothetical protein GWN71_42990 [Gammaproteobacteria bacterium]|nr:hypothetical protein [Gemmatimonadota bacterium]NIU80060.1 hypothetical protein [Gammaproteobacteria bacterium]